MDRKDVERVATRAAQSSAELSPQSLRYFTEYVRNYVQSGETYGYHISDGESINAYASLLGLESLAGKPIARRIYHNDTSLTIDVDDTTITHAYPVSVEEVLQVKADEHSGSEDDNNDFHAGIAVQLDDVTYVAFGLKSEELVGICADCEAAGYDDDLGGCGHAEDTFLADHWLMLCSAEQLDDIDWFRGDLI